MARLFRKAPAAIAETPSFLERCNFSLDELRKTEYPDETRQGFATPQDALVALAKEGVQAPLSERDAAANVRDALDKELAVTAELKYAPYFLTVHDIVRFARSKRHPVPGPRLGGEFRHLLLPRHHRGRSREGRSPVRALRLRRAARAARHRRRLRARAARGGDPVHLRTLRPRSRRACRHRHLLSRPQRHPRGRQGLRPVRRHDRRARQHAVGLVDGRRHGEGSAPRRARSRPIRGSSRSWRWRRS